MRALIWIILIALVIGFGIYYFANRPSQQASTPPVSNQTAPTTTQNQPSTQAQTVDVDVKNFSFNPAAITVSKGTMVRWENYDPVPHRIKSNFGFNSDNLKQGDKYQFTFNTPGTYPYICEIHPSMHGTIIVR